jgi:cytochrome P450
VIAGPRPWPIVGSLIPYYRDPAGFVTGVARRHGDVALVRIAGVSFYLLSNPADIDAVLGALHRDFDKGSPGAERRLLFGNGLATSDGDSWKRQRRLTQPAFHRQRIAAYGEAMVERTLATMVSWREGQERDLHVDMMRLTLENVAKTLFNAEVGEEASEVGEALAQVMAFFARQENLFLRLLPRSLRKMGRARFRRSVDKLDRVIFDLIAERRRNKVDVGDLLSMLIAAQDEDGSVMSDQQLRDEVMTLFLAGHETTALALSWTFSLVARHPDVDARLAAEVSGLGSRPPCVGDLPRLTYADRVIKEAMRLYPPAWIMARQARKEVVLGGHVIPEKAYVVMSPWVVHRDARYFQDPDRFLPERWECGLEDKLPRQAYFPFGGGPRVCIGRAFALMEATLALATIVQRFRMELLREVVPQASLSLRPKGGVPVRLHDRQRGAA